MAKIDSLRVLLEEFESRFVAGLSEESVLKLIEDVTNRLKFSIESGDVEYDGVYQPTRFVKIDTKPGVIDGVTYFPLFHNKSKVEVYEIKTAGRSVCADEGVDFRIKLVRGSEFDFIFWAWRRSYGKAVEDALEKLYSEADHLVHSAIRKDDMKRHPEWYGTEMG